MYEAPISNRFREACANHHPLLSGFRAEHGQVYRFACLAKYIRIKKSYGCLITRAAENDPGSCITVDGQWVLFALLHAHKAAPSPGANGPATESCFNEMTVDVGGYRGGLGLPGRFTAGITVAIAELPAR